MTRLFFDTEFIDNPWPDAPELISIGIVDESGKEFYAVNTEFDPADANDWVQNNVFPHLRDPECSGEGMSPEIMRRIIMDKWLKVDKVWAYCGTWDWYLLVQRIFGGYMKIPEGWPNFYHELGVLKRSHKCDRCMKEGILDHHALGDAKWNHLMYAHLKEIGK